MTLSWKFSISSWKVVGNVYKCQPFFISIGDSNVLEGVRGNHLSAKNNSDVEALEIFAQNLPIFLKKIDSFFPNLIAIHWANSGLTSISAEDLKPFPGLRLLRLLYNRLTHIDSDLFKYTKKPRVD